MISITEQTDSSVPQGRLGTVLFNQHYCTKVTKKCSDNVAERAIQGCLVLYVMQFPLIVLK